MSVHLSTGCLIRSSHAARGRPATDHYGPQADPGLIKNATRHGVHRTLCVYTIIIIIMLPPRPEDSTALAVGVHSGYTSRDTILNIA